MKNMKNKFKFLILILLISLAQNSLSSEPVFKKGSGQNSVVAGIDNEAIGDDSCAFGQNNKTNKRFNIAFGKGNITDGDGSAAFGNINNATDDYASAFGVKNVSNGKNSVAFGYDNQAKELDASAFGVRNIAKSVKSIAIGIDNTSLKNATSVGYKNYAGVGNVVVGKLNNVKGKSSTVIGASNKMEGPDDPTALNTGEYNFIFGNNNTMAANTNNNFIIGNFVNIGSAINNSIVLGSESTIEESNTLSIGSEDLQRRIVHVAAGTKDTDAVNKKQMEEAIAAIGENTSSSFKFKGDTGIEQNHSLSDVLMINGDNNISTVASDNNILAIKLNSDINLNSIKVDRIKLSTTGIDLADTKITNLADATIDASSKEAVNGKQLFEIKGRIDKLADATDDKINIDAWKAKLGVGSSSGITTGSDIVFEKGTGENSVVAGKNNKATMWYSSAFGHDNEATESYSSAFGFKNQASGDYSSAFGSDNKATKQNSSAFGYGNRAEGTYSSAFGRSNEATGNDSSAFGFFNLAEGVRSAAFGLRNKTYGNDSFAFGRGNQAIGNDSFAFGYNNKAKGKNSFAFGHNNETDAENTSAFGFENKANGENSSAFGFANIANGEGSSAFGFETAVLGVGSGAFGRGEYDFATRDYLYKIEGDNSWAIGSYNKIAVGSDNNHILGNNVTIGTGINNSVVLGNKSVIKESNTVSIGSENEKRRIVFVADGTKDTDAATIGQVRSNFAKKDGSNLTNTDVTAWKAKLGVGSGSQSGTSVDAYTKTESDNKFAEKTNVYNKTESDNKYLNKTAYDTDKVTFAAKAELNSKADKNNVYTKTDSDARFAIKTDLESKINKDASNLSSTDVAAWKAKLGVNSSPQSGTSVDAYTKTESDNKFAEKSNVYSKAESDNKYLNKTTYDTDKATFATKTDLNSKANKTDVYTKTESNNKFAEKSNVYSKAESDNKYLNKTTYDTDKATFATKVETDDKLNTKAKKDGSNLSASDIATWKAKLATGSVSSIANTAGGTESTGLGYGNVVTGNYSTAVGYKNNVSGNNSGAFGDPNIITGNRSYAFGNDNNIAGDDNFVMGSNVNIGAGITNSVALGNNSTVSSSNEVSVGSAGKERKITNVADGVISATSTDAVNGKQLYQVANSVSTGKTDILRKEFIRENEKIKNEVRQVGSLSAALSALHPLQYDKNKPNQIMAGFGQYRDKSAVAVGMAHYFTENLMMTGGVSLSEGSNTKAMANVGLTWKFGKGGSESTNAPNYVVQNEVSRLAKENNEQKDLIRQQNLKLQSQDERIKNLENKLELLLKTK